MTNKKNITQPAWDLFCKGDLGGAEQAAALAMKKLNSMAVHPVPDIMILKAYYMCRLRQFKNARHLFTSVLDACPDDAYAQQGYLLALSDELRSNSSEASSNDVVINENTSQGRLLLGLGTGRSGSTTLTKLWSEQESCYCSHEHPPRLPWGINSSRIAFHQQRFNLLKKHNKFIGDVSHWWLPYIEHIIESDNDVRIVVLKRDCNATVNSFMRIKGGGRENTINHWMEHGGNFWSKNIWDECYPSYDTSSMEEAIERYWVEYYTTVDDLVQRFPSHIQVFSTEQLSDSNTQADLLLFCGFKNPRLKVDLILNKGDAQDGIRMY